MAVILLMLLAAAPLLGPAAARLRLKSRQGHLRSAAASSIASPRRRSPAARFRITASGGLATRVTDLAGTYELKDIAAGSYFLRLECPGYLRSCYGFTAPDGAPVCTTVDIVRDQQRDNVDVSVIPGAIARGQVMTFDGRPVTRASVRLGRGMKGEPTFIGRPYDHRHRRTLRADQPAGRRMAARGRDSAGAGRLAAADRLLPRRPVMGRRRRRGAYGRQGHRSTHDYRAAHQREHADRRRAAARCDD